MSLHSLDEDERKVPVSPIIWEKLSDRQVRVGEGSAMAHVMFEKRWPRRR
jgi:hypothetical protein